MLLEQPASTSVTFTAFQKRAPRSRTKSNQPRPTSINERMISCAEARMVAAIRSHTTHGVIIGQSPKDAVRYLAKKVDNRDHECGRKKQLFHVLRIAFVGLIHKGKIVQREGYFQLVLS